MTKRKIQPGWTNLEGEVWKPYPRDPRFYVSSFGRVRFKYKAPKNIRPRKNGYFYICSTLDGQRVAYAVSCMVLETFKGPAPEGYECSHQDGNQGNDRTDNLEWETHKDNCARKVEHGTERFGSNHPCAKLTATNVREILNSPLGSRTIAPRFNITDAYVRSLRKKGGWKHGAEA